MTPGRFVESLARTVDPTLAAVDVLVVDDDKSVRTLLTEALEMYGASVMAVDTAAEALAVV